jgi:hypothetical protein
MKLLFTILRWINKWFIGGSRHSEFILFWETQVNKWITTRGTADTCKRIKQIQLHVLRYLGGKPLTDSGSCPISLNSKGLPKSLGKLLELIDTGDKKDLRLLLTLLNVRRAWDFKSSPNLEPIQQPTTASSFLEGEMATVIEELGWHFTAPHWISPHVSSKAGPNGLASISCFHDMDAIPQKLEDDLHIVGGTLFTEYYNKMKTIPSSFITEIFKLNPSRGLIRKLSIINDPEGKSRIIGILDYWSQTVLIPLHSTLFKVLRKIDGDCTFDQLSHTSLKDGPFYSIDLTSATDRFPVSTQVACLAAATKNKEYAEAWGRIMVDHEFYVPWLSTSVKYACGQPMGAYSSWAMFAFTHHVLVRLAAKRAGFKSTFDNYILLGDDIVIGGQEVAESYLQLLDVLGLGHSPHKTHVSHCLYEFAKRIHYQGVEITGAQVRAFLQPKWATLAEETRNLCIRFHIDPMEAANPALLKDLLAIFKIQRSWKKAYKYLNFPRVSDLPEVEHYKLITLIKLYLGEFLGCSRSKEFYHAFVWQTLNEVKTAAFENAIKDVARATHDIIDDIVGYMSKGQEAGLLMPKNLLEIPVIKGMTEQMTSLQDTFDQVRTGYWDSDREVVLMKAIQIPKNPERFFATRTSELIIASNASLVNQYSFWVREYKKYRAQLWAECFMDPSIPDGALARQALIDAMKSSEAVN